MVMAFFCSSWGFCFLTVRLLFVHMGDLVFVVEKMQSNAA